jgi:hypothetical protein
MTRRLVRVGLCVAVLLGIFVGTTTSARASDNARFEFAFFYQEVWSSGTRAQQAAACRNFRAFPNEMLDDLARNLSAEFNSNFGPHLKPPKRITLADARFVIRRGLIIDCAKYR